MKKKETEESKRKKKKEEEITMKLPKIETIKLHEQNNVNETKKKGGCC